MSKIYLVLQNKTVFCGNSFGSELKDDIVGEAVFTTTMTGYLETLSDKSYFGQIVIQTFPLIGNYGVIMDDLEGQKVYPKAYVVKEICEHPSNFRCQKSLDEFLKNQKIVGISGIDTRELTKIIRKEGTMNAVITLNPDKIDQSALSAYKVKNAVANVSIKSNQTFDRINHKYKIAVIDYGYKNSIVNSLIEKGCQVTVFPHDTAFDEILRFSPNGIMLTNGPGDPSENLVAIATINKLIRHNIPIFGICLGHQLLALSRGFKTEKLKYGHRGANQAVRDNLTGKLYITSQNHGYAVVSSSIDEAIAKEYFTNVNDSTCEGIIYKDKPAFSVQFHPEASAGPLDTSFLFERFLDMIGGIEMPRAKSIKRVLVIGSGPIVIGQAAEFDYAGTQACQALHEDNIEIVLINSNPATIMTDSIMADKIYIEPLTLTTLKRIILKEKPDSILSGLGGQTGLNLSMSLAKDGFLEKNNVRLLGASPAAIDKAENRRLFKQTMEKIGQPSIPSAICQNTQQAIQFANEIGYPVIIRPSFTLGGSGGGIVNNQNELTKRAKAGLQASPITQILVEKCVSGWKEIEFEVIRDGSGNAVTVCSMENFDPVGIHTGDSIVIAPTVTLSDKEYQMLRTASLNIISALGVEGGCNVQFALNPTSFEYAVIEVNPRVSRSSALASKATGYPIAKVATKIAIGYRLDEILNAVTGKTYAAFEPALDYVAVKLPKWPFDKFVYAKRELGTQMKATGEVMAIADSFEDALKKAIRGAELSQDVTSLNKFSNLTDDEIFEGLKNATDQRLFVLLTALNRGISVDVIHELTKIDKWFLNKLVGLDITNCDQKPIVYKMVDTCAAEFSAETPYFYGITTKNCTDEALPYIESSDKERIIVLGSGPIRIGQGIEFDYASVHCVRALKKLNYETVIINNNPETVSTDFDTSDRLYFEPLTENDVMSIIKKEKPYGVVVAFGGQTAIKLTKTLAKNNVRIIGTSAEGIDKAEDRELFDSLLESLNIKRPKGMTVTNVNEALNAAKELTYPVLLRPSYVLGGQNMIIATESQDIIEYMEIILSHNPENSILIDKYIEGREIEVDAICDGYDILVPGIMEHVERAGIHSGDSIAIYPATNIDDSLAKRIIDITKKLCLGLKAIGLTNIQYIIKDDEIYIIEANPRASRTVPYLSKVSGVPMCELAVRVSLGQRLKDLGYGIGLYKSSSYTAVKVPVFSFEKLAGLDTLLGPEMKSTGEVLGIGKTLSEALFKGLTAAEYSLKHEGGVFITVKDSDKMEIIPIAKEFSKLDFTLYATSGTAKALKDAGICCSLVNKISQNDTDNTMSLLESGKITYIIATSSRGRDPRLDEVKIRRKAVELRIPCLTSLDTANALSKSLVSGYSQENTQLIDINNTAI